MSLPWTDAVDAGIVTDHEADLFRECVQHLSAYHWRMDTTGLETAQVDRLARVIAWFTTEGGVQ